MQPLRSPARLLPLIFVGAVTACSSSDDTRLLGAAPESSTNEGNTNEGNTNEGNAPQDAAPQDAAPQDAAPSPAVMVAVASRSPEGTNFYVGAYPELPAEVDLATMLETPSGQNASTFNGAIYVWSPDSGVYTRYAVDEQLRLSETGAVSFANEGGTGNVMTRFISPTRAYSMTRDNLRIIVWDPSELAVLGSMATRAPRSTPATRSSTTVSPCSSATTSPGPSSGTATTTSTSSRRWT